MVIVCVLVAVGQLLREDLVSASLTVGVRRKIFLDYLDNISTFHPIEVIIEATSGAGQPGAPWEAALKLANLPWKANLVDLGEVFLLA